jgi:hypothetical protein
MIKKDHFIVVAVYCHPFMPVAQRLLSNQSMHLQSAAKVPLAKGNII